MRISSITELLNQLEKDIRSSLEKEVAETVKDDLQEAIQSNVYNAYAPKYYSRRKEKGGMLDRNNIESRIDGDTLTVKDIAPLDNGRTDYALDNIIVNGLGNMPFPRDFYSECADKLETTGDHIEAMKCGLKKSGYGVK